MHHLEITEDNLAAMESFAEFNAETIESQRRNAQSVRYRPNKEDRASDRASEKQTICCDFSYCIFLHLNSF